MKRITNVLIATIILLYACSAEDGVNGLNSLIDLAAEPMGDNCAAGGVAVNSGLDANNNGILDEAEVSQTEYLCNGTDGTNGTAGANGTDGINGTSDKEIRFDLSALESRIGFNSFGDVDTTNVVLRYFDIRNYPDVDSAVLAIAFRSNGGSQGINVTLFDKTNQVELTKSRTRYLESPSNGFIDIEVFSNENFIDQLPQEKVNFQLMFEYDDPLGQVFETGDIFLILFRD